MRIVKVLFLSALISLTSCGGGGGGGDDVADANLNGTWTATVNGQVSSPPRQFALNAVFTLTESNNVVSGTYTSNEGLSGTLSGVVDGRAFTFTLMAAAGCPGTLDGSATVDENNSVFTGTYSGEDCNGDVSAGIVANKVTGE